MQNRVLTITGTTISFRNQDGGVRLCSPLHNYKTHYQLLIKSLLNCFLSHVRSSDLFESSLLSPSLSAALER